jgi:hypothetical protein
MHDEACLGEPEQPGKAFLEEFVVLGSAAMVVPGKLMSVYGSLHLHLN